MLPLMQQRPRAFQRLDPLGILLMLTLLGMAAVKDLRLTLGLGVFMLVAIGSRFAIWLAAPYSARADRFLRTERDPDGWLMSNRVVRFFAAIGGYRRDREDGNEAGS